VAGVKTLILLGGGVEAVPIIRRVRELGFRAVVVDGDAGCAGRSLADDFVHASCYHGEQAIPALSAHAYGMRLSYDGVMCAAVDAPVVAAEIAAAFGLPSDGGNPLSVEAARLSMDKLAQKGMLAGHVPLPMFRSWPFPVSLHKMDSIGREGDTFVHVVKPVDSRGGRGVIRITESVDPAWAYEQARSHSPTGRVMVEQWLDGLQLSTESIVQDGRVLFTAVGLRNYARLEEFAPFVIEDGFDEPWGGNGLQTDIGRVIESACRALEWYQSGAGIVKGDLVVHDGRVYVIELAARLSGGFFATHGHPMAYGVDFVGAAARHGLGYGYTEEPKPYARGFVSQRYVFPAPEDIGKAVDEIRWPDEIEGVLFHTYNISTGKKIEPVDCHPRRWGQALATGRTPDEARQRAEAAVVAMKAGVVLE